MSDRPAPDVSLVVPVYNERENIGPLVTEIAAALGGRRYEIVAVDDGSTDGSLAELQRLKHAHPELHIVVFAGNAGQSAAFVAGFRAARGRAIVTLDADLQNDPADVPALLAELERSGAACVAGYRANRRDTPWRRLQSRIANGVRNWLTAETIRDTGCSLKAFRADALRALPAFNGMHRFLPTLIRRRRDRDGGAGRPPAAPLRDDQVRNVEPRIPRPARRIRRALAAAPSAALPGAGGASLND